MNRIRTIGLLGAASTLFAAAAAAQTYSAPKNAHGQPDITGAWSNATLTPQTRSPAYGERRAHTPEEVAILENGVRDRAIAGDAKVDLSVEPAPGASDNVGAYDQGWIDNSVQVMRVGGEPRTSLITTGDGRAPVRRGAAPRTLPANAGSMEAGLAAARDTASRDMFEGQGSVAAARAGSYDNPESRGAGERCLTSFGRNAGPPMFPNGWYNNNYQIVQGRDSVAIVVEMVHDVRIVRLNSQHRTDGVRPWFGDSIGWYEGDTLVVETTNMPQRMAYSGSWENLKVTERFTRVADDRVLYQFTVEDPTIWDTAWGGEYEFYQLNGQLYEYACHEGNYALEGILAGARAEEAAAAASR